MSSPPANTTPDENTPPAASSPAVHEDAIATYLSTPTPLSAAACLIALETTSTLRLDAAKADALQASVATHLHSAAQLVVSGERVGAEMLTAESLAHILTQLGDASGTDAVADAFAAAQVLLHGVYRVAPAAREPIRLGLFLLLRLMAERIEAAGDLGDALCVRSVIRILRPIVTGMRGRFAEEPHAATHCAVDLISKPLIGASVAPQAFDAFGSAWFDLVTAVLAAVPEEAEDDVRTGLIESLCDEFGGKAAHFRSAAVARMLGKVVSSASKAVITATLERVVTVVAQGLQSDVSAVCNACVATCSEGLVPSVLPEEASDPHLERIAKSLIGDQRKLHWDIEVVLEMGRLWNEIANACGDRWTAATAKVEADLNRVALLARKPTPQTTFGETLLAKCAAVASERALAVEQSKAHREAAVAELSHRSDLRHMNFVFGRELGSGAFSTVTFAKYIQREVPQGHWLPVAVKSAHKAVLGMNAESQAALDRELALHRELSDDPSTRDGIVRLYSTFQDAHHVHMVMELCPNGDLHSAVLGDGAGKRLTGYWRNGAAALWLRSVLWDAAHAIEQAHTACGIMVGDIKPENIVVATSGRGKLADFGAAMRLSDVPKAAAIGGTLHYMAPELLRWASGSGGDGAARPAIDGVAADWWSFAVTCAQLLTGVHPFEAPDMASTRRLILSATPASLEAAPTWPLLPVFVQRILQTASSDATRRRADSAFKWIRDDPYFADCDPPFMGAGPRMPPHLAAAAATATRNSGRKQSVMWRKQASAEAMPASSVAVDILSGEVLLQCEPMDMVSAFDPVVFELLPKHRRSDWSAAGLSRGRPAAASSSGPDLSSYMTTRPPLPRR